MSVPFKGFKVVMFFMDLLLVIAIWIIDFRFTGPQITFTLVYLIPISLSTWYVGYIYGLFLSFLSTLAWFTVYLVHIQVINSGLVTYGRNGSKYYIFS